MDRACDYICATDLSILKMLLDLTCLVNRKGYGIRFPRVLHLAKMKHLSGSDLKKRQQLLDSLLVQLEFIPKLELSCEMLESAVSALYPCEDVLDGREEKQCSVANILDELGVVSQLYCAQRFNACRDEPLYSPCIEVGPEFFCGFRRAAKIDKQNVVEPWPEKAGSFHLPHFGYGLHAADFNVLGDVIE